MFNLRKKSIMLIAAFMCSYSSVSTFAMEIVENAKNNVEVEFINIEPKKSLVFYCQGSWKEMDSFVANKGGQRFLPHMMVDEIDGSELVNLLKTGENTGVKGNYFCDWETEMAFNVNKKKNELRVRKYKENWWILVNSKDGNPVALGDLLPKSLGNSKNEQKKANVLFFKNGNGGNCVLPCGEAAKGEPRSAKTDYIAISVMTENEVKQARASSAKNTGAGIGKLGPKSVQTPAKPTGNNITKKNATSHSAPHANSTGTQSKNQPRGNGDSQPKTGDSKDTSFLSSTKGKVVGGVTGTTVLGAGASLVVAQQKGLWPWGVTVKKGKKSKDDSYLANPRSVELMRERAFN